MKTWVTNRGRTITAPSFERAVELARQYDLGEVIGLAEVQADRAARERRAPRAHSFVLWDDLTQTEVEEGPLDQVAARLAADPQGPYVILARGPRGLRPLNAVERRRLKEVLRGLL